MTPLTFGCGPPSPSSLRPGPCIPLRPSYRDDAADLRMRSSQSHESLLSAVGLSSVDLSAPDVQIKPLHSSVLTSAHCFHVYSSAAGSRYYSCRTAAERQNWIEQWVTYSDINYLIYNGYIFTLYCSYCIKCPVEKCENSNSFMIMLWFMPG